MSGTYTRLAANFRVQTKPSPGDREKQRLHATLQIVGVILVFGFALVWIVWSLATRQIVETYYVDGHKLSAQEFQARAPQTNAYLISSCLKAVPERGRRNPECDDLFAGYSTLAETARAQGAACELANPARTIGMFGAWSDMTAAMTCEPVAMTQRDLYAMHDERLPAHLDPATSGPVARYLAREYRRSYEVAATYTLYYLSQRDGDLILDERFVMVRETKHGARIDWSSSRDRINWGYVQPGSKRVKIQPNTAVSVKKRNSARPRADRAGRVATLGQGKAMGCRDFDMLAIGSAPCVNDDASWRIGLMPHKAQAGY